MPAVWRYVDTGICSATYNMAVDEAMMATCNTLQQPILRIYGWHEAVSFGKFSKVHESIDSEQLATGNIEYVRRPTGGGILLHGHDLSYTVLVPKTLLQGRSVKESYEYLCRFLFHFYERLGLKAVFAKDAEVALREHATLCLSANEPHDIMIEGRKMGGNAQWHTRSCVLQHGTVPMIFDTSRYEGIFHADSGAEQAASLQRLGITHGYNTLSQLLHNSFCECFDAQLEPLDDDYMTTAQTLLRDKYMSDRWNLDAD